MKRSFVALLGALLMLLVAIPASAQEQTASIQGTVTDATGAALPGVTVEAVNNKGQRFTAVTDSSGNYRFPSVPPGVYSVSAALEGMEPANVRNFEVKLGTSPRVDLRMRIGALAEAVTVTAEAPLVDMTSSATQTSIRSETFEVLPKGRDFSTVVTQAPSANFETKQGAGGSGGISINGASGSENRYIVDGVDTTNPQTGTQGKVVITDFIDEIQVKSAGYQAEFGGAIGGVINVITKTGTNDFRGSVGAYYTDTDLGGGEQRPTLQENASGTGPEYKVFRQDDVQSVEPTLTFGGPLVRDRLHFFAAYSPTMVETSRTVDFASGSVGTFGQDFERNNYAGTLSGNVGSKLLYKASYNNSGYEQENILPAQSGRGSADPSQYTGKNENFENWTASGYADFVASQSWLLSVRGGRFYRNIFDEGIASDPVVWFAAGSPSVFEDVPPSLHRAPGFRNIPTNSARTQDAYTRDNLYADGSWFFQGAGSHALKAGVQIENLKNEVNTGFQNYWFRTYWNRPGPFLTADRQGKYGVAGVYVFKTLGEVESNNLGLFLQDSWTTLNNRLTLNLGVRTERERVPSYADPALGLREYAIEFDFEDKLAPRLGFAYDVTGDGRWKTYGSYGQFYDITKTEMPRGSFGGDKWIWFNFAIDDPDWTKWSCTNVTTQQSITPSCTGMTFVNSVDLRHPSLDLIEPDLKPMQSNEYTLGLQHELTDTIAVGVRYVNKQLVRTIEDVGVLVTEADGSQHEEYFISNPGEGIARHILGTDLPALPKARRDYQALEFEATRRFVNRWSLHASYVYSELEGNYSGLASSDENGRNSPNVNRYFDNLFNSFDAQGRPVYGKLATDRPHVFKAQVAYGLPWGTTLGVNQYVGSGTPISTEFMYHGVPFFAYGRGDMGRTPTLTRTDMLLQHDFRIFGDYALQLGLNVLNLFDEDTAVNINNRFSDASVNVTDETFFQGFDPLAALPNPAVNKNNLYGQENQFQAPREVRLSARFTF